MNDESSSGGQGPSSIKPPTIKPPTAQDNAFGATTLGAAPRATMPLSAPSPSVGAMPQMQAAPPRPQQNLWPWMIIGALVLLALLVVVLAVLAVVVILWVR